MDSKSNRQEGNKCHYPNCGFNGPPSKMKAHIASHENNTTRSSRIGIKHQRKQRVKTKGPVKGYMTDS